MGTLTPLDYDQRLSHRRGRIDFTADLAGLLFITVYQNHQLSAYRHALQRLQDFGGRRYRNVWPVRHEPKCCYILWAVGHRPRQNARNCHDLWRSYSSGHIFAVFGYWGSSRTSDGVVRVFASAELPLVFTILGLSVRRDGMYFASSVCSHWSCGRSCRSDSDDDIFGKLLMSRFETV